MKSVGTPDKKLLAQDLIYFGLRDFESAEAHIIEKEEVSCYKVEELRFRGLEVCVKEAVEQLKDCDHVYISFDVDSLDPSISLGTGTPVPNGLTVEEAIQLNAELIKDKRVCCWEIVEVNPTLDSENRMAEIAFEVLEITTKSLVNHF